nr:RNA-directed DNA polymerase, eukaryota [Tanacetum cinerariifolium]
FINVFSVERLVNNLCTVWIDRLKLHANVTRFNRASVNSHNHATQNVGGSQVQSGIREEEMSPALVLDDNFLMSKDVSKYLLGRVKEVASLANLKMALYNKDFVTEGRIAWVEIEGIPLKIWSDNTFKRIAAKWGELLDIDDHEETCFHSKRLCILTKDYKSISDNFKIVFRGKETGNGVNSDAEEVPETAVEDEGHEENNADEESLEKTGDKSEDPFNIYSLLKKNNDNEDGTSNNYEKVNEVNVEEFQNLSGNGCSKYYKEVESDSICSGRFKKSKGPKTGGSSLNLLDEVVKVGQVMGYKMDGCMSNMVEIIESQGAEEGILCVWDPNSFCKSSVTISDSFVTMRGVWRQSGKDVLLIVVYAPHDFKEKLLLWDYLNHSIGRWNGKVLIMGDFNEVRYKSDRFFHYWSDLEGFGNVVEASWKEYPNVEQNAMLNMMGKLKHLKKKIREWNIKDKQRWSMDKDKYKVDLEALDTIIDQEMAQKAKVKWSIEGDENTSFFHGVINKKRNLLNIRGIMVDGSWVDEPSMVKREFFNHFRNRFDKPDGIRAITHMEYPRRISLDKQSELEGEVSNDEIKRAVWDCGTDKAPEPDGFTFGFYRRSWYLIDNDVYAAIKHFFIHGEIPKGCNSSFIALIPKISDANLVKDFRPISLIGSLYKIIAKILTNRLAGVLGDIVNEVQSAFVMYFNTKHPNPS